MTRKALALVFVSLLAFQALAGNPPVSPDPVVNKVESPSIVKTETKVTSVATSLPPTVIFDDLPVSKFGDKAITQSVTIKGWRLNDATVCVQTAEIPLPVVAATNTCAEVCAADSRTSTMTCDASAGTTDGEWIDASETQPHLDQANICYCARAQSGGTTTIVQTRRVAR